MNMTISTNGYLAPRRVDLFNEVSKELDHAINNIFGNEFFAGLSKKNKGYPLMDAARTDNELIIQFTVPGVEIDDLNVEVSEDENGNVLSVSGFLHDDYVFPEESYHIRELSSQDFRRLVRLPKDIDSTNPKTFIKDGILTLRFSSLAKKEQTKKSKKIDIIQK
jgi:HSP20 family molecular chaperone IbpA